MHSLVSSTTFITYKNQDSVYFLVSSSIFKKLALFSFKNKWKKFHKMPYSTSLRRLLILELNFFQQKGGA